MQSYLVVDDEPTLLEMVGLAPEDEGCEVLTACNGIKARELMEQTALARGAGWRPDLVLLDLRMPLMDGRAFAAEFRARYGDRVPIVLLTAMPVPEEAFAEVGANAALSKPFELCELVDIVRKHTGEPGPGPGLSTDIG